MLRALRNIVRNGNSMHVALPPRMLNYLRWRAGDTLRLEIVDVDKLTLTIANVSDLRAAPDGDVVEASMKAVAK